MRIIIDHNDLQEDIAHMLDTNQFESISIDYVFNAVMGWKNGEEITIHDFSPYLRLDNRFSSYELEVNFGNIVIDFTKS